MIFLVAFGALGFASLLILLMARFSPNPAVVRLRADEERARVAGTLSPRIPYNDFRMLIIDLMEVLGFTISLEHHEANEVDLIARCNEPLKSGKYIVHAVISPPGDIVPQPAVMRLHETVRAEGAAKGILFTPYSIDTTGIGSVGSELELVDGHKLREMIEKYLPKKLDLIDGYRGF
jgi:hypothetical protein